MNFQDCFTTFNIREHAKTFHQNVLDGEELDPTVLSERFVRSDGTIIPSFPASHPFQSKSWFRCSTFIISSPRPTPRWRPTASISKMMAGAAFCILKRSRLAPTPTTFLQSQEPEILKNGTPGNRLSLKQSLTCSRGPLKNTLKVPYLSLRVNRLDLLVTTLQFLFFLGTKASENRTLISSLFAALYFVQNSLDFGPLFPPPSQNKEEEENSKRLLARDKDIDPSYRLNSHMFDCYFCLMFRSKKFLQF